jgi:hypothetical protein
MKGYKVFNNDWTCKDQKYEIGKIYKIKDNPVLCEKGFHFCTNIMDCFNYYDMITWNKIAEVEALGKITEVENNCTKRATDKIKIIKEIKFDEFIHIAKTNRSNAVNGSYAVNRSEAVNGSEAVNWSNAVNRSNAVNGSEAVNRSNAVNGSEAVNRSNAVNRSYGILNCFGISESIFCVDIKQIRRIFNKIVSEERYKEVINNLKDKLNGWEPQFNDLKSLYIKNGSDWRLTPIYNASDLQIKEAWGDMPKNAIKYIKSLPEFNANIFEKITGIK